MKTKKSALLFSKRFLVGRPARSHCYGRFAEKFTRLDTVTMCSINVQIYFMCRTALRPFLIVSCLPFLLSSAAGWRTGKSWLPMFQLQSSRSKRLCTWPTNDQLSDRHYFLVIIGYFCLLSVTSVKLKLLTRYGIIQMEHCVV